MDVPTDGRDGVDERLQSANASVRVAHTLLGVALDVLVPYASDYLTADEYDGLCELVTQPVQAATTAALETLSAELRAAVEDLDPAIKTRLDTLRRSRL